MNAPVTAADATRRHRTAQAAAFDRIGARYQEAFAHNDGQQDAVELLLGRLPAGARVLDVGCGTGIPTARALSGAGCAVTGIDISPVMLDLARRNVPGAVFLERDVRDVGPELGRFDAVVAFFALLMLPRAEIVDALVRLRGVLEPEGLLMLGMVEADVDDVPVAFLDASVRVSGWRRQGLRRVLAEAGFAIWTEDVRSYQRQDDAAAEVHIFVTAQPVPQSPAQP